MAVFRRQHLDRDQLGPRKHLLDGQVAGEDANVGDPKLGRSDTRTLLDNGTNTPFLCLAMKPEEKRGLNDLMVVFAKVPVLQLAVHIVHVWLVDCREVLFNRNRR